MCFALWRGASAVCLSPFSWICPLPPNEPSSLDEGNMENPCVILLPHPGSERLPNRGETHVTWPQPGRNARTKHARKFLRVAGKWVLRNGEYGESMLEFWAEYEGPTQCEAVPRKDGFPRFVQTIDANPGS